MSQGKDNGKVIYSEDNNGYHFYGALRLGISNSSLSVSSEGFTHVGSFSPFLLGQLEAT